MSDIGAQHGWHTDPLTLLPVLDDEAAFREANSSDPALEVRVALWSGDPDRAAALLRPLVDDDPTSWRLQALAADVIRNRGNVAAAVQFRRALDLSLAADAPPAGSLVAASRQALDRALDLVPGPLVHTRPWSWGVAFLHDPIVGEIPEVDSDAPVTVTPLGLIIRVRNASDIDWSIDEDGPAVVTVHLGRPPVFTRPPRAVVVEAELETPSGSLRLDDADDAILVPAPGARTRVVISHEDPEWNQPDEVWVDLYPAG